MGEFKQLIFVHRPIQLIFQIGELPLCPRRSQEEEISGPKGEAEEGEGGEEEDEGEGKRSADSSECSLGEK